MFFLKFPVPLRFPLTIQKRTSRRIGYSDLPLVVNGCINVCVVSSKLYSWDSGSMETTIKHFTVDERCVIQRDRTEIRHTPLLISHVHLMIIFSANKISAPILNMSVSMPARPTLVCVFTTARTLVLFQYSPLAHWFPPLRFVQLCSCVTDEGLWEIFA